MSQSFQINCEYNAATDATITLPEGRRIEDIKSSHVAYDTLYIRFKDGEAWETRLDSDSEDNIDWNSPTAVSVNAVSDDGDVDYDIDLASEFGMGDVETDQSRGGIHGR